MQDAALANELAGEYILRTTKDVFWANVYFSKAYYLYELWGAEGKMKYLRSIRGQFIQEEDSSALRKMSSTMKPSHIVTKDATDMYKVVDMKNSRPSHISGIGGVTIVSDLTPDSEFVKRKPRASPRSENEHSRFSSLLG